MKNLGLALCILFLSPFYFGDNLLATFTNGNFALRELPAGNNVTNRAKRALSPAQSLLQRSMDFHDPEFNWGTFKGTLDFTVELPEKPDRQRKVTIDNAAQHFLFEAPTEDGTLVYEVKENVGVAKWNGQTEIPEEMAKKHRISIERSYMYRDYYLYLYGMPMKLMDPGTIIDPEVEEVEFYGKKYDRIRVSYEPPVGDDIWYFYFDPNTSALEAYQFFHDEEKNDGEYILFEELKEIDGIKIPRIRKWFYNKDEKYLATDVLN